MDISIISLLNESPILMCYWLAVFNRVYFILSMFYTCKITWFLQLLLGLWLFEMHVFSFTKWWLLQQYKEFLTQWGIGTVKTHYRNTDIILPTFSLSALIFQHRGCNIYVFIRYRSTTLGNISLFPHFSGKPLYRIAITFWGTAHRL